MNTLTIEMPCLEVQSESRMYRQGIKRLVCKKRYMKLLKRGENVVKEYENNKPIYFWYKLPEVKIHYLHEHQLDILDALEKKRTLILDSLGVSGNLI